ncbi:MAG: Holliday junction resolvase RuvX [Candidatus Omnitrophota bacterium]|jgi:putative Holliday junction resolvase
MSAYLGLDFGRERIGVAVSDESGTIASGLLCLRFQSQKGLLEDLRKLAAEYKPAAFVAGLPKTLDGRIGPSAEFVMKHVDWLRPHFETEWVYWDERLTTAEVERMLIAADVSRERRREVRDQLAAQRILQGYLDSRRT